MEKIHIQFSRFSAFYSPLIIAIAGNFLQEEGFIPEWSIASSPSDATLALANGSVDIIQSAVSQGFGPSGSKHNSKVSHFAQINQMDGFFITSRKQQTDFKWHNLEGSKMILQPGGQPLAMFKYACKKAGIDFNKIEKINPLPDLDMDQSFRIGHGDYIQQQGPAPQQLEADGYGYVVANVGAQVGVCAFSSLAARKIWLEGDKCFAFIKAYSKARNFINEHSAIEISSIEKPFFPDLPQDVLSTCIDQYKKTDCWGGPIQITEQAFNSTVEIFNYNGLLQRQPVYSEICKDIKFI